MVGLWNPVYRYSNRFGESSRTYVQKFLFNNFENVLAILQNYLFGFKTKCSLEFS